MMTRRLLLTGGGAGLAGMAIAWGWAVSRAAAPQAAAQAATVFPLTRSDEDWHRLLTPDQYAVLRRSGTERPFTSPLLSEHRRGNFACAGCDLDLFPSTAKFDSGTGWPSFWAPLENAVGTEEDRSFGVVRNAVHCRRCGSHLGHVFDDGPKPTGLRYCMNGIALTFKPATA